MEKFLVIVLICYFQYAFCGNEDVSSRRALGGEQCKGNDCNRLWNSIKYIYRETLSYQKYVLTIGLATVTVLFAIFRCFLKAERELNAQRSTACHIAVHTMSKAVDAVREENSKLRGQIKEQNRAIEEQNRAIKEQNRAIKEQEKGSCLQM